VLDIMFIPNLLSTESGSERVVKARIIVVEDEPDLREAVAEYLGASGYDVTMAENAVAARALFETQSFHLAMLDIAMPGEDGLSLGRWLRSKTQIGIIYATAAGTALDRIVGLELGADDYLTKPFGLRELLARIRAVLRRRELGRAAVQRGPERGRYRFGGWLLDRRARRLTDANGTVVTLSKGEYALLVAFIEAPQRPLSREQLLQATRIHEDVYDRTIDVQVLRLRRKLETEAAAPQIIQTERGVGYVFALPVEVL
jgi:DNA-binding response OmpR family regulator